MTVVYTRAGTSRPIVKGHGLKYDGAPLDEAGRWIHPTRKHGKGHPPTPGRGGCYCGALSEVLPDRASRRAWHDQHKLQVIADMREDEEARGV